MTAALKIRDGAGTLRTITQVKARDGGGTLRTCTFIKARDSNNVLRTVYSTTSPLSASASPTTVYGSTLGTGSATTDTTTVTPAGGTAPYTYSWAVVSYDNPSAAPTATASTAATTAFTQTSIGIGEAWSATWRCTVTDADTNTATVDVQAFWTDTT